MRAQGPNARLERPLFTVLAEEELPRPGMVFGIDAEFVALSRPDKILQGCAPGHPFVHPCAAASVTFWILCLPFKALTLPWLHPFTLISHVCTCQHIACCCGSGNCIPPLQPHTLFSQPLFATKPATH